MGMQEQSATNAAATLLMASRAGKPSPQAAPPRAAAPQPAPPRVAPWLAGRERSILRRLVERVAQPGVVSLAGGLPAVDLFPSRLYGETLRRVAANPQFLQYASSGGELRERVVEIMRRRGVECTVDEILITTGSQQALDVAVRAFVGPGEAIAVERYTYAGFREAMAPLQPELVTLPSGLDQGLDVEALERELRNGRRPRLVYVIPDAHNPLGVSLAPEIRERLTALAHDHDFVILEDDPYGLLPRDGAFHPPMAALDAERVIYAGTFSKILAPALRLGWLRLPPSLVEPLGAVKEITDLECSGLTVTATARLLEEMDFDRHLERLRATYGRRRDAMLAALADHLPAGCAFTEPGGGMFVWVELPEGIDGERLLEHALAERKIAFVPGSAFADEADRFAPRNVARLSFSQLEPEALREAVASFAACLRGADQEERRP